MAIIRRVLLAMALTVGVTLLVPTGPANAAGQEVKIAPKIRTVYLDQLGQGIALAG